VKKDNQLSIAREFLKRFGSSVRCENRNRGNNKTLWYWVDNVWRSDRYADNAITSNIVRILEQRNADRLLNKADIDGIKSLVGSLINQADIVDPDQWDSDLMTLNTPAGIVDLKTGLLKPADRMLLCTRMTAVAPSDDDNCSLFKQVLNTALDNNQEKIAYFQRLLGYSLTGKITEQAFFVLHGEGANGKSVLLNALKAILKDYAKDAPANTFTSTRSEQHPTNVASMVGARMVVSSELSQDTKWNEALLKQLTGDGSCLTRRLYEDFFEFDPKFKLFFVTNHVPNVSDVGEALRRRMKIISFERIIPKEERIKDLGEQLKPEYPAILRWLINGCLDWQERGSLDEPCSVTQATDDYFTEQDIAGECLRRYLTFNKHSELTTSEVYSQLWKPFCEDQGENPGSRSSFGRVLKRYLKQYGIEQKRNSTRRFWLGVGISDDWLNDQATDSSVQMAA
jgi:putative DNA primase/helicase